MLPFERLAARETYLVGPQLYGASTQTLIRHLASALLCRRYLSTRAIEAAWLFLNMCYGYVQSTAQDILAVRRAKRQKARHHSWVEEFRFGRLCGVSPPGL